MVGLFDFVVSSFKNEMNMNISFSEEIFMSRKSVNKQKIEGGRAQFLNHSHSVHPFY